MSIRWKIVLIVVPLLVATLLTLIFLPTLYMAVFGKDDVTPPAAVA